MSRTIYGVIAAVLLAGLGTVLLVLYVQGAEERALAGQETVEVLVVNELVARGTPAEDLATFVTTERIPAKVRAADGVVNLDDLDGQLTSVDLVPGEQLVASRFLTAQELVDDRGVDVPEGLQELTVSLDPQRVIGGQLRPGDSVGVFASFDFTDQRGDEDIAAEESEELQQRLSETTKKILDKILITNVLVDQLPQATDEDGEDAGLGQAPTGNLLVTFAVDVPEAERIVFTAEHGTLWLSNEPDAATEDGSQLRVPRNIYDD